MSFSVLVGVLAYGACSSSLLLLNKMAVMDSGSKTLTLLLQFLASILVVVVLSKVGSSATPLRLSVKRAVRVFDESNDHHGLVRGHRDRFGSRFACGDEATTSAWSQGNLTAGCIR
jgi:hypothetical protein